MAFAAAPERIGVAPRKPPGADLSGLGVREPGSRHYDETQFITFMETNVKPNGSQPLPPMPEYKLKLEDAAAVAAYLKSLPPAP